MQQPKSAVSHSSRSQNLEIVRGFSPSPPFFIILLWRIGEKSASLVSGCNWPVGAPWRLLRCLSAEAASWIRGNRQTALKRVIIRFVMALSSNG